MEKLATTATGDFIKALASKEATPGGGGAAAAAGALGAALGCMVGNLSLGKKSCAEHEAEIADALKHLELISNYMLNLADEDAKAFAPLQKYMAAPKDDPERTHHLEAALRVACHIPTEVLYTAAQAIELLAMLAEKGSKSAISDVGIGIELCRAAMRASRLNILINAAAMTDEVFSMTLKRESELVFEKYDPIIDKALATVDSRILGK